MDKPTPLTTRVPRHILKAVKKEARLRGLKMYEAVSLALAEWLDRRMKETA